MLRDCVTIYKSYCCYLDGAEVLSPSWAEVQDHFCADLSLDGTVLVVGLPDNGYGGRSVRVYQADQTGTFHERLNVTAPTNGPGESRFGAQVLCSRQLFSRQ